MAWSPPATDEVIAGGWSPPETDEVIAGPGLGQRMAAGAVQSFQQPPTPGPEERGVSSIWGRLKKAFVPTEGGLTEQVKRMANPMMGRFGLSRFLQQEGQAVRKDMLGASQRMGEAVAESPLARVSPHLAAGVGTALGTVADVGVMSAPLTPEDAQMQVAGMGIGPAGKAVFNSAARSARALLKPSVSPALAAVAENAGVPLTPADVVRTKGIAQIESALERNPITSGTGEAIRAKQTAALTKMADNLDVQLGTPRGPLSVGADVQGGITQKTADRYAAAEKLFKMVDEKVPPKAEIPVSNLNKVARELLAQEDQLPANMQTLRPILKTFAKDPGAAYSWEGARGLWRRFNDLIGGQGAGLSGTAETRIYRLMKKALAQDIDAFAANQGGQISTLHKVANWFYGKQKDLFGRSNKTIQGILRQHPEDVVDYVLQPGSITEGKILRNALPAKEWDTFQRGVVNRLFKGRANQTPFEALSMNLDKYGRDTVVQILGESKFDSLQSLAQLSKTTGTATKMAGNPSGTAQVAGTLALFKYGATNPIQTMLGATGGKILAKLWYSQGTRDLLTKALTPSLSAAEQNVVRHQLTAAIARLSQDEKTNPVGPANKQAFSTMVKKAKAALK